MGLINTEEAAKRLARVILSDIELYGRERPQLGETLAAQIEEGRRLFGSRVTPAIVPLFDVVLSDRRTASGKTPALAATSSAAPRPTVAEQSLEDHPTPGPALVAQIFDDQPTPGRVITTGTLADVVWAHGNEQTPAPVPGRTPQPQSAAPLAEAARRSPVVRVQVEPLPAVPFVMVAGGASPAPPSGGASEVPVPVLTSRISIPKLLAVLAMAASAVAIISRCLS